MKPDYIKVTKTTVILDTDTAELKSQCKSSLLDSYIFGNCPKFSLGKKVVKVCALLPLYFLVVKDLSLVSLLLDSLLLTRVIDFL